MDSNVQTLTEGLAIEEGPAGVGNAENVGATGPRISNYVSRPKQCIPLTYEEGVTEGWFATCKPATDDVPVGKGPLLKPGRDDRKSHRRTVEPSHRACEVKVGSNALSATLVNESKDGFAVLMNCVDGLKMGKKVELLTKMGRFTVRIVYIKKVARPDHTAKSDSWFRLGVKKASYSFPFLAAAIRQ